jgi:hypothetical protein
VLVCEGEETVSMMAKCCPVRPRGRARVTSHERTHSERRVRMRSSHVAAPVPVTRPMHCPHHLGEGATDFAWTNTFFLVYFFFLYFQKFFPQNLLCGCSRVKMVSACVSTWASWPSSPQLIASCVPSSFLRLSFFGTALRASVCERTHTRTHMLFTRLFRLHTLTTPHGNFGMCAP